ncbi:hypothetical protein Tco_1176282 [Tanacetum coccineum]
MFSHRRLPTRLYILIPGGQGIPVSFDEELRKPMVDQLYLLMPYLQPFTGLYIVTPFRVEDEEGPEEDPAEPFFPVDGKRQ